MTSPRPLLSMIVPAKDQAPFLTDCLTSLTRQFDDGADQLEVIVIDDGSTDATGTIAQSFRDRLPRLQVIRNDEARGLASARNQGLARCSGRYIGYLDGDDWLAPGHLSHLCREIARLDVDFVRTDHVRSTRGRRSLHRAPEARRHVALDPRSSILPDDKSTMVDYCYAWAGLFDARISHLLPFPEGLFTAEDRAWCWRLHLESSSYAVVNAPGILYRRGVTTSLTQIFDRRQLDFLPSFRLVFDLVEAEREADRWWPKASRMFLGVLAHHLGRSDRMTEGDAADLQAQGRAALRRIPEEVLAQTFARSTSARRELLAPLLLEDELRTSALTRAVAPLTDAVRPLTRVFRPLSGATRRAGSRAAS